jgi:hypothetical protein
MARTLVEEVDPDLLQFLPVPRFMQNRVAGYEEGLEMEVVADLCT